MKANLWLKRGEDSWKAYNKLVLGLPAIAESVDATGEAMSEAKRAYELIRAELLLQATLDGKLDGKNAETREAQLLLYLSVQTSHTLAVERLAIAEIAHQRAKREWELAGAEVQLARYLVALRTAELNVVAGQNH